MGYYFDPGAVGLETCPIVMLKHPQDNIAYVNVDSAQWESEVQHEGAKIE